MENRMWRLDMMMRHGNGDRGREGGREDIVARLCSILS
jgi:hypothetical protein